MSFLVDVFFDIWVYVQRFDYSLLIEWKQMSVYYVGCFNLDEQQQVRSKSKDREISHVCISG